MTKRRKDVSESIFIASSLSVDCQSVFHPSTSFPRDLGNGMSLSQNRMPSTSSSSGGAFYAIIDCTRPSNLRAWRSSSKIDLAFGWLRNKLLVLIDWTGTYIINHNIIFGMKKGYTWVARQVRKLPNWASQPSPSIYGSLDERSEKIGFCGNIGPESLDTLLLARLYFVWKRNCIEWRACRTKNIHVLFFALSWCLKYKITPTNESTGLFSIYTNGTDIALCDPQRAIACCWRTCAAVNMTVIRFVWAFWRIVSVCLCWTWKAWRPGCRE